MLKCYYYMLVACYFGPMIIEGLPKEHLFVTLLFVIFVKYMYKHDIIIYMMIDPLPTSLAFRITNIDSHMTQ
jgi:hypothetical protein